MAKAKSCWRKLYWTTEKNSDKYKAGCVEIYSESYPDLFYSMSLHGYKECKC